MPVPWAGCKTSVVKLGKFPESIFKCMLSLLLEENFSLTLCEKVKTHKRCTLVQRFPTQIRNTVSYPTHKMVDNSLSVLAKQQVWILKLLILRGEKQKQNNLSFRKYQNQNFIFL